MSRSTFASIFISLLAVAFVAGCSTPNPTDPPEGWVSEGDRWWDAETDTAGVFRDLSSIESMSVDRVEGEYGQYIQDRLEPLYVSNPNILDSLYEVVIAPTIEEANREGRDAPSVVDELSRELRALYRQPVADHNEVLDLDLPADFEGERSVILVHVVPVPDSEESRAVADAVRVVESVGTEVDAQLLAHAARRDYYSGWVIIDPRTNANRTVGGWIRLGRTFE